MKAAPLHFREELKRIDSTLRLRWSRERGYFVLERKIPGNLKHQAVQKPIVRVKDSSGEVREVLCPEHSDRYVRWKNGYIPLMDVPVLDRRLIDMLQAGDMRRQGKYFVQRLEEKEEADNRLQERRDEDEMYHHALESYDRLAWREGRRVSVGGGL